MKKYFQNSFNIINDYSSGLTYPDVKDDNLTRMTLGEIKTYLNFLDIVLNRYEEIGGEFTENNKNFQASLSEKEATLTKEQMEMYDRSSVLNAGLRLEIETFFLFAHILLNKITNYPEIYFTKEYKRGIKCGSHHQFWRTIRERGYFDPLDERLKERAEWLQINVVGHRDHLITHTVEKEQHKRMLIKGISFPGNGKGFSTMSVTLYPDDKTNSQSISISLEEIIPVIDDYISLYFEFLKKNIDKSIFN
jgi:hypothetical protein